MKKIFYISVLVLALFNFSSCETEDARDPRPVIVGGQYVRLDITDKMLAFEHLDDTKFGGLLTAPSGNVQKYVLKVRKRNPVGVTTGNYVELLTVNTFPYQLEVTPQMIATAIGVNVTDLEKGDTYVFFGEAYGFDGTKTNYNNLSATVRAQAGMKQAFRFVTSLQDDNGIETSYETFNNYQLGL